MAPRLVADTHSLDDLELELRKLPGVRAAGFEERDDMLLVHLHVGDSSDPHDQPIPVVASRIAARYSHQPVAIEIVRWRDATSAGHSPAPVSPVGSTKARRADDGDGSTAPRARLLAVLAFPESDELEVHLIHAGRRTIGRAAASDGLLGVAEATIDAITALGVPFKPRARWAREVEDNDEEHTAVAVALEAVVEGSSALQYGLASGASPIDAAARSTLDALNRRLALLL